MPECRTFEEALSELEIIVTSLERGDEPLQENLEKFEKGVSLVRSCRQLLDQAESRIMQFVEIDEMGLAKLKPFDHESSMSAKQAVGKGNEPATEVNQPKDPSQPTPRKKKTKETGDSLFEEQ